MADSKFYCIYCGEPLDADSQFCTRCGRAVDEAPVEEIIASVQCPHCGAEIEADDEFCAHCGNPLNAGGSVDAGTAPRLVGNPVAAAISAASEGQGLVRRVVAALHDTDIQATNAVFETSVPFSGAQNAFLRLIKRGILLIAMLLVPLGVSAGRVIEHTFSKGGMSARIVVTLPVEAGLAFDETEYTIHKDNTAPQDRMYTATGATIHNGDTFKVECFVNGESQKFRVVSVEIAAYDSWHSGIGWNVNKSDKDGKTENGQKVYRTEWQTNGLYSPEKFMELYGENVPDFHYDVSLKVSFRVDNSEGEGRFVTYSFYVKNITVEDVDDTKDAVVDESVTDDEDEETEEAAVDSTDSAKHVTVDSTADTDEETWRDWVIPGTLAVLIGGGGGAGAYVANSRRKKKKKGAKRQEPNNSRSDDNDNDDDDEENYTYALRISKRLGDSVIIGDEPRGVYAYIVRIDKYGTELTDERLTRMIQIEGDGYLIVSGQTYQQGTMSANVEAPKDYEGVTPEEGIVSFRIAASEGSFTNRMHFKIAAPSIDFAQDELTLPANLPQAVYLPFEVTLMGDRPVVEIAMSDDKYTAQLEYDEHNQLYYAVIAERPLPEGAPAPNEVPGTSTRHYLTVKAAGEGRKAEVQFLIERFVMGLACNDLFGVKCYLENYDPMKGHSIDLRRKVMLDTAQNLTDAPHFVGREMAPAVNKFTLSLYEYDAEKGRIICIPPTITRYEVIIDDPKPVGAEGGEMLQQAAILMGGFAPGGLAAAVDGAAGKIKADNEAYEQKMKRVAALGFHIDAKRGISDPDRTDQSLVCYLSCRGGILDAPNRWKAHIYIEAENEGRKYVVEKPVLLLSQPKREWANPGECEKQQKLDEAISEELERMRSDIHVHHYEDMHLLEMFIERMLKYYDYDYGYDWQQVRAVMRTFNNYLNNERLINQYASEDETLCIVDGVARTLDMGKRLEEGLGFFPRMALGIATFGISEGVFNTLEVVRNMKDYVDKGGDSVFVGWCLGAQVPIREYLMGKLFEGVGKLKKFIDGRRAAKLGKAKGGVKTVGKSAGKPTAKNVGKEVSKEAAEEAAQKAAKNAAEKSNLGPRSTDMEKMAKKIGERSKAGKNEARKLAAETKKRGGFDGERLDPDSQNLIKAEKRGLEKGQKKLDEYRRLSELPDTMANRQKRIDALMEIQKDKHAMSLLNDTDNQTLNSLRKQFNGDMKKVHYSAEFDMKAALADQLERDPRFKGRKFNVDDIHGFNASKSTKEALAKGEKITMDYDGTFFVIDKKTGQRIYLEQEQVEGAFQQFLYKKATGKEGTPQLWAEYMGVSDHTIIQSDLHIESYGIKNVDIMLDNARAWEALPDAHRVAKAATDKCMHWYNEGMRLVKAGGQENLEKGVAMIRESLRQCKKQFDNFAVVRDVAREATNGGSKISAQTYAMMNYIGETDIFKGSLTVGECLNGLESMGTSAPKLFRELGSLFEAIG